MAEKPVVKKTRYPGIYRVSSPGKKDRFRVMYRIRGLGQHSKTKPTLEDAKVFQASVRDPARAQQLRQLYKGSVPLGDYFPLFLERRRNLAPSTRARYESAGKLFTRGRLGRLHLSSITRDDVEAWIADLEGAGRGPGSIDKAYRTLRAMLSQAELEGKLVSNPARKIQLRAHDARYPFFLTAEQVDAIANEVPRRHRALVYLLAYTGLRIGEASALRVHHLELTKRVMTVRGNSPEVGGRKLAGATKTKRVRAIDLSEELCLELAEHLELFGGRAEAGDLDTSTFVFTHAQGGQIRQNNWRARVFQPACVRAGVVRVAGDGRKEPPRVHDLRHTAASLAADQGFSLHEVKELLGHTTIKTTSDLYLHLFSDAKREKSDRMGELMRKSRAKRGAVVPFERPETMTATL